MSSVNPTGDERTANNTMRQEYRILSEEEKAQMRDIKDLGSQFFSQLISIERVRGRSSDLDIAKQKIQEAVFWVVHEVTK